MEADLSSTNSGNAAPGDRQDCKSEKRKRRMTAKHVLAMLNAMRDEDSDGGEVSGISDLSWTGSESSSESDQEVPKKVKPRIVTKTLPPQGDLIPDEVLDTEPPPAEEKGKDGTVWNIIESGLGSGRRPIHTVLKEAAGPTLHARRNISSILSAFMCLCDEVMLQHIRDCTAAEAIRADKDNTWDISVAELKAFIAILYLRGACCGNGLSVESFWSEQWGNVFFKTTLTRERFRKIMRYLRFDYVETRPSRQATDKFAHVREVWDRFVQNCITCYKPGLDITVDEQLFPTKSRCPFTQYMPRKPDKFGIKFWLAVDVDSKYMLNGFPYLGKDPSRPAMQGLAESVVMKVVEPFLDKGRNITTDNFFTSVSLAKKLLSRKTSLVGTMNKKRRELPLSVGVMAKLFSTKLLKHEKVVLSIYQCRPKRNVVILSTRHRHVTISKEQKQKPETVTYYNYTKVGVDVLDQMLRKYTVKASTYRWPVAVFYNMLDMALINSWVLYRSCTSENISRRDFMQQLALELRAEWMAVKEPPCMEVPYIAIPQERRRVTCMVKSNCKQNKTLFKCVKCRNAVCGRCTAATLSICSECI